MKKQLNKEQERIKEKLRNTINDELTSLNYDELTDKQKTEKIDNISKLHKLLMEELKETNNNSKRSEWLEKGIKFGIEIGAIILPLVVYSKWMKIGYKFEETGVLNSTVNRETRGTILKGLFNRKSYIK